VIDKIIQVLPVIVFAVVPAIVLHECAHGWMADRLGDPTARQLGRLTLNPLRHIDPVGSILVPGMLYLVYAFGWTHSLFVFGWAKPVPVNFARLRNPRQGMIWVALAGPCMNIVLALLCGQILRYMPGLPVFVNDFVVSALIFNIGLAIFNMIPVPPLDGSRVAAGLMPLSWARKYFLLEPVGFVLVIILLNTGMLDLLNPLIYRTAMLMGLK
jgi:Zn-dependent protease